jgi:20S proteasome subunit alpha 7
MASSGSGYDLSSSTFSPDGRIFQIEYASKAVESAGTALGVRCSDGIVMAVEKPLPSKMMLSSSSRRIHTVDAHSGVAFTGFVSDARQIMNRAREEAGNYNASYGTKIPPALLAQRIASYVHYFTLHGSLRPFGATIILASYDPSTKQHELHMIEPSGVSYEFFGCAAGKGRQSAKTEMEKLSLGNVSGSTGEVITAKEAVKQLARIICMLHDDEKESSASKPFELEMSWVCEESKWEHVGVPRPVIAEAIAWAKESIAEDDDEEDEINAGGDVMAF